jgi:FkbM family methyltransferase
VHEKAMVSKRNVSYIDELRSILFYPKRKIGAVSPYRRVYRNYIEVLIHILRNKYPAKGILRRDNQVLTLHSHIEAFYLTSLLLHEIEFDLSRDLVTLNPSKVGAGSKITMLGATHNGDLIDIFIRNSYDKLPVEGKTIIDIGANIGDSAVYFALRGAKRIIAVEPYPKNYEIAKRNIEMNSLSNVVKLVLAACSNDTGYITIDPAYESNASSYLTGDSQYGMEVPRLSIETILHQNDVPPDESIVLKVDCEGCEYDFLLSMLDKTLRRFSHIQIEYHHGYKNLEEKLLRSGFRVFVSRPAYSPGRKSIANVSWNKSYVGWIFGERS